MVRLRPARSWRADSFLMKPSCLMASLTRLLVGSATMSGRFSTLETVPTETPACAATSLMLAGASATVPSRIWCKCAALIWNVSNSPPFTAAGRARADVTIQLRTAQLLTRRRYGLTLLHIFETLHPGQGGWVPGNPEDAPAGRAGPVLSLRHAAKSFGAVHAVVDGSADLYAGEAHALVGENGAGKSTVVKMLAGVYQPDEGELLIGGAPVTLHSPAAARDAGIAVIYQEPTLFPDLTVAENIFMGRQPLRAGRRIDGRLMRGQAAALFERLGVRLDPGRICRGLSIADQQIVEIAKALSLDARVIVMDEPTAALSAAEVARLFEVVRALRAGGAAVLFISHRLEEVFEICQRVTVMRDGRHVLTSELAGLTADDLVRAMVGRECRSAPQPAGAEPGTEVLRVERLTREGVFTDVSLQVRAGEIVVLAGLVGSGRSEVARAIFGIDRYDAGTVTVAGQPLRKASPGGGHGGGRRLRPRGPAPAGPGHGHVGAAEHGPGLAGPAAPGRAHPVRRPSARSPPTGRSGCG